MMHYSSVPHVTKMTLGKLMLSVSYPILGDISVYILLVLLVIFCDEGDPDISNIQEQYMTMLMRYLAKRRDTCMNVPYYMGIIKNCLNTLPIMAQSFINRNISYST